MLASNSLAAFLFMYKTRLDHLICLIHFWSVLFPLSNPSKVIETSIYLFPKTMPKNFMQKFFSQFFLHVEFEYHVHFYSKSFHFFDLIFTYFSDSQFLYLQHRNSVGKNLVRYSDSSSQKTWKKLYHKFSVDFSSSRILTNQKIKKCMGEGEDGHEKWAFRISHTSME